MPGGRKQYYGVNIRAKNKRQIVRAVEKKIKLVLRVRHRNTAQGFISVPTNTFQPVFYQKAGVYGDLHR